MATIATLNVALKATTESFTRGLSGAGSALGAFSLAVTGVNQALELTQRIFNGVQSAVGLFTEKARGIEALGDAARTIGIEVAQLQQFQHAARLSGVEAEEFQQALIKMNRGIADAAMGTGEASDFFNQMGIDVNALIQQDPVSSFLQIAGAIQSLGTAAEQTDATMSVFGRSGTGLIKFLNEGPDAIRAAAEEMATLRGTVDELDFQRVKEALDDTERFQTVLEGITDELIIQLAPAVEQFAEDLTNAGKSGDSMATQIRDALKDVILFIAKIADGFQFVVFVFQTIKLVFTELANIVVRIAEFVSFLVDLVIGSLIRLVGKVADLIGFDEFAEGAKGVADSITSFTRSANELGDELAASAVDTVGEAQAAWVAFDNSVNQSKVLEYFAKIEARAQGFAKEIEKAKDAGNQIEKKPPGFLAARQKELDALEEEKKRREREEEDRKRTLERDLADIQQKFDAARGQEFGVFDRTFTKFNNAGGGTKKQQVEDPQLKMTNDLLTRIKDALARGQSIATTV